MSKDSPTPPAGVIRLRGVRQNNLRGIDCDLPLGKLIVITGVSGSGKSSLAFDTLYAEGQRRYVETFSAYTRQFLDRLARPAADRIEGIPPAVAIDASGGVKTSRSTVGTLTGINDYLKLLWTRASAGHCLHCGKPVEAEGTAAVLEELERLAPADWPAVIIAPVPLGGFASLDMVSHALRSQGFLRFWRGGEVVRIDDLSDRDLDAPALDVVIDRLTSARSTRRRRADSVEQAFRVGHGAVRIAAGGRERAFSADTRCGGCGEVLPRRTPGLFSFNTPYGACPACRGFGRVIGIDWGRVIPDETLSLRGGAIRPWRSASRRSRQRRCLAACASAGIPVDVAWRDLPPAQRELVLEGGPGWGGVRGFFRKLEKKKYRLHVRVLLSRYRGYFPCPDCGGGRLRPEALAFRVRGRTLPEFWALSVRDALELTRAITAGRTDPSVRLVAREVASRLEYLSAVGLDYLTLGRASRTLSGGEVERVHLTSALGANLVDTLFVLDEPSIGLHARDNGRLVGILEKIRDRGNTVVVVEHDLEILRAADHLIDLGPGSGRGGGTIVARGSRDEVASVAASLTGGYLSGRRAIPLPPERRRLEKAPRIEIRGARENNLQGVDVDVPLEGLTVVSGVSGSGKSTLLHDVLYRAAQRHRGRPVDGEIRVDAVRGLQRVDDVVLVDQSPIGRTPRGNAATYTKVFSRIRTLFARSEHARAAGLGAGSFSFNVEGGRCAECAGVGAIVVEMQFLSDVTLPCEVCGGKRFRPPVLAVRWRGKNIHEVLESTIEEAIEFFAGEPDLQDRLAFLDSLGLGYLRIGQPINTLSGGEAQRLKLAARILATRRERLLFLLDEPTTGLHLEDVRNLLRVLRALVERGHGVVVIEHHLDVIAAADRVIDLGPEGGDGGGRIVARGTPEEVARCRDSITGRWLERHLARPVGDPRGDPEKGREPPSRRAARSSRPVPRAVRKRAAAAGAGEAESRRRRAPSGGRIRILGARENNLRDIDVEIPRNRLVVVTGLSGAGKSTLVHDIVFAEGQRRYLDCLSAYARQFVEELHRPDIDHLEGIPPSVAVEQRTTVGGRKSTVGTVTEVYHFLRLLYTRVGVQICPDCRVEVAPRARDEILAEVARRGRRGGWLLAPVARGKKGFHNRLFSMARRRGILDARVDGEWIALPERREIRLARNVAHDIDLVTARLRAGRLDRERLEAALDLALELGGGVVKFRREGGEETLFNLSRSCPACRRDFDEPDPLDFSFHSRRGACPRCEGRGGFLDLDSSALIRRWDAPLDRHPKGPLEFLDEAPFARGTRRRFLREVEGRGGLPRDGRPLARWGKRSLRTLLEGVRSDGFEGLLALVRRRLERLEPPGREEFLRAHGAEVPCPQCEGTRLRRQWREVRWGGHRLPDLTRLTVGELRGALRAVEVPAAKRPVVEPILQEVQSRLRFLEEVGLAYLTLDRSVATLSGGESQRIRLASQLGSNLRGACYILDEPTIGLHPRDNERLLATLRELRDRGNSVIVVEHDDATIEAADEIIDLGPGPGVHGGRVVAQGPIESIRSAPESATGEYFRTRGPLRLPPPDRSFARGPALEVRGATRNNLRAVDASFPLGAVTVVTGVSGAGKSTLVRDVLETSVRRRIRGLRSDPPGCGELRGAELVEGVREVDQLPIGRTPRSTPATYVGLWTRVRRIFAALPEARARGFDARRFSFNVPGGRCETCAGQGRIRMEMEFLPDVTIDCEQCGGTRFSPVTREVTYSGKDISEVLALSVEEAIGFFASFAEIERSLKTLDDLGLGYLTLGQASTTLSGGEAQRVKLAVELSKRSDGPWLYLFDEPTTGLHMKDVARLVGVLRRLARAGHVVVVVEHHLEVIAGADRVIDLGPEGGEGGGRVLYEGPVGGLPALRRRSATAACLARAMERGALSDH